MGNAQNRPATVADCVSLKRVLWEREVQISPECRQVAYVLKAPNVVTNQNDSGLREEPLTAYEVHTALRRLGKPVDPAAEFLRQTTTRSDGIRNQPCVFR